MAGNEDGVIHFTTYVTQEYITEIFVCLADVCHLDQQSIFLRYERSVNVL